MQELLDPPLLGRCLGHDRFFSLSDLSSPCVRYRSDSARRCQRTYLTLNVPTLELLDLFLSSRPLH